MWIGGEERCPRVLSKDGGEGNDVTGKSCGPCLTGCHSRDTYLPSVLSLYRAPKCSSLGRSTCEFFRPCGAPSFCTVPTCEMLGTAGGCPRWATYG